MAVSSSHTSAWTLFPEALHAACLQCRDNTAPPSTPRLRRLSSDNSPVLEPAPKRRLVQDKVLALGSYSADASSSTTDDTPVHDLVATQDWVLVRQWHEPLGDLPRSLACGHLCDPSNLPPLTLSPQEGTLMAMLDSHILSMRQDDPPDEAWTDPEDRGALHSPTLFSAVEALRHTQQVALTSILSRHKDTSAADLVFKVFLHKSRFSQTLACTGSIDARMQDLVHFAFPVTHDNKSSPFTRNAIKDLYTHLKPSATGDPPKGIQPPLLQPQLLPFQRRSVAWCLQRECGVVNGVGEVEYKEPILADKLPLSWDLVTLPSGQELLVNRLCGIMCQPSPKVTAELLEPRGGILAEEMGLGKTVEMLALILLNRRQLQPIQPNEAQSDTGALEKQLSAAHLDDSTLSSAIENTTIREASQEAQGVVEEGSESLPSLIKSGATLIITPLSILHQWAGEIESHVPSLRVFVYMDDAHERISAEELAKYDVVLTTYPVLSKEVNYTTHYDRPRRYERQYKPRKSPFVKIDWWRVCLDEAQMIEGITVSQAAAMTLLIPRVMAWCISGTPIRRHIEDLHSLLRFLDQEPVASNKRLWKLLASYRFRSTFISSYQRIMHRYAKKDVVQELALPRQMRIIYGIRFTDVERANYNEKWEQCLAECSLDNVSDNSGEAESLQNWLVRLRQTCCHPQIGSRNKDALGKTNLRTIDEVLDVMIQQANTQLYIKERLLLTTKIKRAVLSARIHKDAAELPLFFQLAKEITGHVDTWKLKYEEQLAKRDRERDQKRASASEKGKDVKQDASELEDDGDVLAFLGGRATGQTTDDIFMASMFRYREWQEQYHRVLFFTAGLYHELEMEADETLLYNQAEEIRQQLLAYPEQKFNKELEFVKTVVNNRTLDAQYVIPHPTFTGGIVMRRHLEQLQYVTDLLNQQLEILRRWRQDLVQRLTQPLMQDGEEGEQYQYSIDLQHTLESYLHFYGRMLLFRKDLVSGTEESIASLVANVESQRVHADMVRRRENRVRTFKRKAGQEENKKPDEDLDKRLEKEMNDLITTDLVSTLRSIRMLIRSVANDTSYPSAERSIAEVEDDRLKDEQTHQVKIVLELERQVFRELEVGNFRSLTAARTAYYRQLQAISDTVRDIESLDPEEDIGDCLEEERQLQTDIVRLIAKQRYLEHISDSSNQKSRTEEDRLCLICRTQYDLGMMTECGHVFCEHCLLEWTRSHHKCPSCNSIISRRRLTRVTMSGSVAAQEALADQSMAADDPALDAAAGPSSLPRPTLIDARDLQYGSHMQLVPDAIRRFTIQDGYGSKIDSIVRHIAYLTREDPETKCLVFSQWSNLLKLLGDSLNSNRIGFVKLDGSSVKTAVKQFKEDPGKHVFMLHAKSQSAGLTLLSATHIFICEPLVNPVLQAQAVSRVHRIGQTKETFVHYYLIRDTVEIPCFSLFERNLAAATGASTHHDGQDEPSSDWPSSSASTSTSEKNKGKANALQDSDIASTTASEVARAQNRHGELVKLDDLKYCFQVQKQMFTQGH
ncbi:hypothetical protein BGZ70_003983 [Mortierella alpina]|uniref:RING-type domain-containing protein n=1 Tax=Mortierella alpina TaxID=64518 RepID=A0A9P6JA11_MORAP|nr:hypothetical protein BGZ70_003983 [Mortierella alpina]